MPNSSLQHDLGTATVRRRLAGPVAIVVTGRIVAQRTEDDEPWSACADPDCAHWEPLELGEVISAEEWLWSSRGTTVRRAITIELDDAAQQALRDWLAAASSTEAAAHDHDRDSQGDAAE